MKLHVSLKPAVLLRNAVNAALWLLLISILGVVLFSYFLPQDLTKTDPKYATLVEWSFFGRVLTFHLGLLIALMLLPALLIRRRLLVRVIALSSLALMTPTLLSLWPHHASTTAGPKLRIMSMNLKYTHRSASLFLNQIRKNDPDILVVQDYTPYAEAALVRQFAGDYPHRFLIPNSLQGLAIFSRLPFAGGRPQSTLTKTRRQMRAVVMFAGQPIVVYVEHPFSPRTRQRIIYNRLATVDLVHQVRNETLPVVVAGDFNFTAETPNESAMKSAALIDAFEKAGYGRGSTWPVEPQWMQWLPGVRIDHVFISPQLTCTHFEVGEYDGSDHLPILADLCVTTSR